MSAIWTSWSSFRRLEAKKCLYDMQQGASLLAEFVTGQTFVDYQADAMLRAAVERLGRAARLTPTVGHAS